MLYTVSFDCQLSRFINISLAIKDIKEDKIYLQLPSWRPGRYELANYAKNIQKFLVYDKEGMVLPYRKTTKDRWEIDTEGTSEILVMYNYYASQLDAGGSWLGEYQLYINFVNCLMYMEGRLDHQYKVQLQLPEGWQIACGLTKEADLTLIAKDYYELADCPMIASDRLGHFVYEAEGVEFHIWIMGDYKPDSEKLKDHFKRFSENQIRMMGEFPTKDYHFLFQALPYKFYHGVEHRNSTVIALGPSESMASGLTYRDLLGISSHELYHAWNIIRIRPLEMMPYDFTKENYFPTGFVAEGVTTYYGDIFLARSGVYSKEEYFYELNEVFKKHFENFGRFNLSLTESSHDLWLDGYVPGIPDRKVSIYHKGAVVALMLDLEIRKATENKASLDNLMRVFWNEYGKKDIGYTIDDYKREAEKLTGKSLTQYFDDYIFGTVPLEEALNMLLELVGCHLSSFYALEVNERCFGFKVQDKDKIQIVTQIDPSSEAMSLLAREDEIIAVNGRKVDKNFYALLNEKEDVELVLFRKSRLKVVKIYNKGSKYFKQYRIAQNETATEQQKTNFKMWIGCDW